MEVVKDETDMVPFSEINVGECFLLDYVIYQKLGKHGEIFYSDIETGNLFDANIDSLQVERVKTKCTWTK